MLSLALLTEQAVLACYCRLLLQDPAGQGHVTARRSAQVISQLLPLPHLRCGFLLAADPERRAGVDEAWALCWFVLDHASLRTAPLQQHGGPGELPSLPPEP